ncbi:MAG TPA: winged helix-turn-helix domain-containing protein, partial [Thermoanaerobaculia bacterium]|nr:winged helix-turn-helix domain-containing protein [Thermoanaerobaculia bacterium]
MARKLTLRQLLLSILALRGDLSQKEIAAAAGISPNRVNKYLRRGEVKDEAFERLLAAMQCPPAAVPVVAACLEALDALEQEQDLTAGEAAVIEAAVQDVARLLREDLAGFARSSREAAAEGYPEACDLPLARQQAAELWSRLKDLPDEVRLEVVRVARELQTWALCERACEESVREASRNLERAAGLARLAREIAGRVQGPEGWSRRLQGYAAAHEANVLRVTGELQAADTGLAEAKSLWHLGTDPAGVLDPGRLLHFEAALRRAQRRFEEALALLDEAAIVSHPERALISKGFTLEVMGEYERAVETLLSAHPLIDWEAEPRLGNVLRTNLAFNFCHVSRYSDAAKLLNEARPIAVALGDEIDLIRMTWLEGRIAAGFDRRQEAQKLLAEARKGFAARDMGYDVALALLEEAVLLLDEERPTEVRALSRELTKVFASKGVHREALAALRLFQETA